MEQMIIKVINYSEIEKLVHETWPDQEGFEFISYFECTNDTDHLWSDVKGGDYDEEEFEHWSTNDGEGYIGHYQLLSALIDAGKLQPGNYLIRVSW